MNQNKTTNPNTNRFRLHIKGRVQGVGFRPFIYRLAKKHALNGNVSNQTDGVIIRIEGSEESSRQFLYELRKNAPPAAVIKEILLNEIKDETFHDFTIEQSSSPDNLITEVCPDIAVCNDCLKEMYSADRRAGYPFINCTNCGPRFTLIDNFPYDRIHTTMREFEMCPECTKEFTDILNRRFHAQPISCSSCGPVYKYYIGNEIIGDFNVILKLLGDHVNEGRVVAVKSLGGYNLVCDALNPKAVSQLRKIKKREKKPFAVMFRSLECLTKYTEPDNSEIQVLQSWQRPIVILEKYRKNSLARGITAGLTSLGAFLPYMPLHYLLFDVIMTDALVFTSGNESDIPILYREDQALEAFRNIGGGILVNNRKIARRIDDSVVKVIHNQPRIFRRARGYVPSPVDLHFDANGILATGAELSNCFCIGKEKQAILSQHIGDLKNAETFDFFRENIKEFSRMYRFDTRLIACDLHPDYLSTRYSQGSGIPVKRVQHHHAHIASVMAEYQLNKPVIGLSYDGTGYGTDGNIWGSELLVADYTSFERISHFEYIPLPGGDLAVKEPWRSTVALLYHVYGGEWKMLPIPFMQKIDIQKAERLTEAIDKKINCPLCCSAGRLFDAVAGLLSICLVSDYHVQAPMFLEKYINPGINASYGIESGRIISFKGMIRSMVEDILDKKEYSEIVTKFHNTIANAAVAQVDIAGMEQPLQMVVLSGGTFQNKYLTEKIISLLMQRQLRVFFPAEIPCNDGGLALGQLAVAAHLK